MVGLNVDSPNKIILLIVLIAILGVGGIIAIVGIGVVTVALAAIFWRTILPGLMILFGLLVIMYGAHKVNMKIAALGVLLIALGVTISLYVG